MTVGTEVLLSLIHVPISIFALMFRVFLLIYSTTLVNKLYLTIVKQKNGEVSKLEASITSKQIENKLRHASSNLKLQMYQPVDGRFYKYIEGLRRNKKKKVMGNM